jgi:hypothetical protein
MDDNKKKHISTYIQEIGERLRQGHASVMIGSGFSRNAKKSSPTIPDAPLWDAVGDHFQNKLGIFGSKDRYMNISKLAEQIEITFDRPALDQILQEAIPDGEYEPSDIHIDLLKLPWIDVFTTNYDTLLERAADCVIERKYETIVNKEDLPRSSKPRIIKLHGSFPSMRPFIITEEDYRTYPQDFAPFVNTVQQSLLENTFCLIGFSCSDPNFLKWIGWINDHLGSNAPKMYMLSVNSLSASEELWLNKHNINAIDLTYYDDNAEKALKQLLRELGLIAGKDHNDKLNWGNKLSNSSIRLNREKKEGQPQYKLAIDTWKKDRETYPGWLILPTEDREKLDRYTDFAFLRTVEKIGAPYDIMLLYECNWRLEKMLSPIDNDWINIYKSIIKRYNPYDIAGYEKDSAITPSNTVQFEDVNWKEIERYWIELQLAILRYYREEGKYEEWEALDKAIATIQDKFSEDVISRYRYEQCLYTLFRLNIDGTKEHLKRWTITSLLSPWIIRKAGLMAEVGMVVDSSQMLTKALNAIRKRLYLAPNNIDYALFSQEAYIIWLLRGVEWSVDYLHNVYRNDSSKDVGFRNRLNELKQYKCDPYSEQHSFRISDTNVMLVEKKWGFGIGEEKRTNYLGRHHSSLQKSYYFLRYMEESGIPPRVTNASFYDKNIVENAIACVAEYSPAWGFASSNRCVLEGDAIDNVWGRKMLSFTTPEEADHYANFYISRLKEYIESTKNSREEYSYIAFRKAFFYTVLSHLTVKCSITVKKEMFKLLRGLYDLDNTPPQEEDAMNTLAKFLFCSFSVSTIMALLPELLNFRIIDNERNRFSDVFNYIPTPKHIPKVKVCIPSEKVNALIKLLSTDSRNAAIMRLYVLNAYHLLNESQLKRFAKVLWRDIDEKSSFPKNRVYYDFAFVTSMPYPDDKDPVALLHQYIDRIEMPIQSDERNSIEFSNGRFSRFQNILGTVQCLDYVWSKDEINTLLPKLIEWWNTDKSYLKREEKAVFLSLSIAQEFRLRFQNMIWVFKEIMAPHVALINTQYYVPIKGLLDELKEYGMPDCVAKVGFMALFQEERESLLSHLYQQLYSNDEDECKDALDAIKLLSVSNHSNITHLLGNITQILKCRTSPFLYHYISTIRYMVEQHADVLQANIFEDIALCMHYLLDEVIIKKNDTVDIVQKKLINKESVICLAISLENYYVNRNESTPDYILTWKERTLKDDEFADIRNIWMNAIEAKE